jgi:hypothetical protein
VGSLGSVLGSLESVVGSRVAVLGLQVASLRRKDDALSSIVAVGGRTEKGLGLRKQVRSERETVGGRKTEVVGKAETVGRSIDDDRGRVKTAPCTMRSCVG